MTILIQTRRLPSFHEVAVKLDSIFSEVGFYDFRKLETALSTPHQPYLFAPIPIAMFQLGSKNGAFYLSTPKEATLVGDSDLEARITKLGITPTLAIDMISAEIPLESFGNSDYDSNEGKLVRTVAQTIIDRWDAVQKCAVILDGYSVATPYEIRRKGEPQPEH